MSDVSQGPGWWQASDGKWYRPKESDQPPAPGWWLAADGKWYPPFESDGPPAPGWWLAADGKWYPPAKSSRTASPEKARGDAAPTEPARDTASRSGAHTTSRPPRTVAEASSHATAGRSRPADAQAQIRRRNDASRQDAATQAPARFLAASRALKLLGPELADATPTTPVAEATPEPKSTVAARSAAHAARAEAMDPQNGEAPPNGSGQSTGHEPTTPSPAPAALPAPASAPQTSETERALIELRTSPLGADIEHLGDSLFVFVDRVELRDRDNHVRQTLAGPQISDVVIQRKFTGAVLSVEGSDGEVIVTRGLKPEQADEARTLIHKVTRDGRPAVPRPQAEVTTLPSGPSRTGDAASPTDDAAADQPAQLDHHRLNEADLLRKLSDLHRAGVLSDAEFESKIALVGRLVSGEALVASSGA